MSETTSAPVAPASAPDAAVDISPAPATQPRLSIADAMQKLRGQPTTEGVKTGADSATLDRPRDEQGRFARADGTAETQEPAARPRSGVAAMEEALGLKPADTPPEAPGEPTEAAHGYELDGRTWSPDALREQIRLASDYTQKTQEVARARDALQAQFQQVQQQQQAIDQFLPLIQPEVARLQAMMADAPMPDPALRQVDPAAYWDQFARHQDAIGAHQRFFGMLQQQQAARDQQLARAVEEANTVLAAKYSFWADPQQRGEVQSALVQWARANGFEDHELRGLSNPRYLEVMMKAMAHDANAGKVRTTAPEATVRAAPRMGTAPPPRPAEAVASAAEAFQAKPSWQNGAALLSAQQSAARRGNGHSNW
jgi:hypothetical protein